MTASPTRVLAAILGTTFAMSCAGGPALDEQRLTALTPLPYRVAVAGGAVLPPGEREAPPAGPSVEASVLAAKTWPKGVAEPIAYARILALLRRGRLCTSLLALDSEDGAAREVLALAPRSSDEVGAALARARSAGADLLLVFEGLREGPVVELGTNGQWPVATLAWVLIGLGMFIPDHRFESSASLKACLRDVHSGELLADFVVTAGAVDLALVERSDFLGIVQSILMPPTLVGSDAGAVVARLREEGDRRLLLRLLGRLKDRETLESLRDQLPVRFDLGWGEGGRMRVVARSAQRIQEVVVEIVGGGGPRPLETDGARAFARAFLASAREVGARGLFQHEALLPWIPEGTELRVLVQTVAGQRGSETIRVAR